MSIELLYCEAGDYFEFLSGITSYEISIVQEVRTMESDLYSFFECNKDLKVEMLDDNTGMKVEADVNEEAALDLEEENEYIAMKRDLEETAQRMDKRVYDSSHVQHFHDDEKLGEYLQPYLVIPMKDMVADCIRFSRDSNNLLAIGTSAGTIEIYNSKTGRFSYKLDVGRKGMRKYTCTSMSFRPAKFAKVTENVLVSCDVTGQIHHWHATSEKHLALSSEPDNEIFAVDHHPTGQKFATSGYDFKVRIYDGITRLPIQTFEKGNGVTTAGHSNRVFAVKWHPSDINITLSGGWDSTIQVWDARAGTSVRSIYGVQICGDALDFREVNNRILTGSWRRTNQLQEWDYGSGKLVENIQWPPGNRDEEPCRLYGAIYGTGVSQNLIAAGGSGTNEACLFDANSRDVFGRISTGDKAVYGVAFSCDGTEVAISTPVAIHLISITKALLNNSTHSRIQADLV